MLATSCNHPKVADVVDLYVRVHNCVEQAEGCCQSD